MNAGILDIFLFKRLTIWKFWFENLMLGNVQFCLVSSAALSTIFSVPSFGDLASFLGMPLA